MSNEEVVEETVQDQNAAVEEATEGEAAELDAAPAEEESGETEETPDVAALRKEAAGHRRKAREAEQERDALAGRVEALQRAEAQRLAGTKAEGFRALSDPSDLWRAEGVELSAMLDDDGAVDPAKVREVVTDVGQAHPGWLEFSFGDADAGKGNGAPVPSATDQFGDRLRSLGGSAA